MCSMMRSPARRRPLPRSSRKWKETNKELLDDEQDMPYLEGTLRVYDQVRQDIAELGPAGARIRDVVTKFTTGEMGEGELQVLGKELTGLSPEQRQKIYRYAAMAAQSDGGMGTVEQFARNLGQSISRSFDFLGVSTLKAEAQRGFSSIETIEQRGRLHLQRLERKPDSPEKTAEIAAINENLEMVKVVRELRDVAKTQIDPIKPIMPEGTFLGTAERGAYGLGGSIGFMAATAVNPALGFMAIADQEYESMRTEFPHMDPNVAGAASLASAAIQTPIEMLQLRALARHATNRPGALRHQDRDPGHGTAHWRQRHRAEHPGRHSGYSLRRHSAGACGTANRHARGRSREGFQGLL